MAVQIWFSFCLCCDPSIVDQFDGHARTCPELLWSTKTGVGCSTQAPTHNFTALRTNIAPPWVPDPDNRGTWSLLYSCAFTLVLCVWTAIHLNVPSYQESLISQWLRKLKWVLLAIIAPELGVYTAFEQYEQAKELIGELAKISVRNRSQSSYRTDQSDTQLPQNSPEV